MELNWSHAFMPVENLTEMLDFYTNVLNFGVTDKSLKNGELQMVFLSQNDEEHHQLAFIQSKRRLCSSQLGVHFAFRTNNLATIKSLYQTLKQDSRIDKVSPVTHGNTWSIYFSDPEGNLLEIFCDTPFTVSQPFSEPWDPELKDETIRQRTHDLVRHRSQD